MDDITVLIENNRVEDGVYDLNFVVNQRIIGTVCLSYDELRNVADSIYTHLGLENGDD